MRSPSAPSRSRLGRNGSRRIRRLWVLFFTCAISAWSQDLDRDGIDDAIEQQILQQFIPTFILSKSECDVAPAEFAPGSKDPHPVARNGTIYGQVFRYDADRLEVHYFHLWARDCGPSGHALDAEHVSALIRPGEKPRAEFWYAAAHEDTVCDAGGAAKASALSAENQGPRIWISRGKHASFLSQNTCQRGCGADRCEATQDLHVPVVINLGEANAPLSGAVWATSPRWPMRNKFRSDFNDALIAKLSQSEDIADLRGPLLPAQAAIAGGGRAVVEVNGAKKRTDSALDLANNKTEKAISGSAKSVKSWLRKRLTYAVVPSRN